MSVALGQRLKIRSMIYVAAEPVPYFWPMRAFIHHNPLHGLENMPFDHAVEKGAGLFHGQGFLPRSAYQRYLHQGKVDEARLDDEVGRFVEARAMPGELDMRGILMTLLTKVDAPVMLSTPLLSDDDIYGVISDSPAANQAHSPDDAVTARLHAMLVGDRPVYEAVDAL